MGCGVWVVVACELVVAQAEDVGWGVCGGIRRYFRPSGHLVNLKRYRED